MRCRTWSRLGWGVIAGVSLWTCGGPGGLLGGEKGGQKAGGESQVTQKELIVGAPVRYKNLTIFPVTSKVEKNQDRFITLDEGLKSGKVEISEVGADQPAGQRAGGGPSANRANRRQPAPTSQAARQPSPNQQAANVDAADPFGQANGPQGQSAGADVNRLLLSNNSDRPLYLMPGEILVGGQQDRTLAQELIVPPKTKRMAIDVFCVEHGRWSGRNDAENMRVTETLAAHDRRAEDVAQAAKSAKEGKFPISAGSLGKSGRLAVQGGEGQTEVWNQVGRANLSSGVTTPSDDFTANYVEPKVAERLKAYLKDFEQPISKTPRVVGVIMAVNGKVEAADVFESTPLFRKLWPKLLKSYALDASTSAAGKDDKPCQVAEAQAFLTEATQAKVEDVKSKQDLVTTRRDSKAVSSFSVHEKRPGAPSAGMGGMGGGFGGAVHGSAFSK